MRRRLVLLQITKDGSNKIGIPRLVTDMSCHDDKWTGKNSGWNLKLIKSK